MLKAILMEQLLNHLLQMPDDLGAYEPMIERAPLETLIRPPNSDREDIRAKAKTVAALFAHGLEATITDQEESTAITQFNNHIRRASVNTNGINQPGIILKLTALLGEYDYEIVRDAQQMRTYVTNRLIEESAPDKGAQHRLRALENLGKITGVDLFTERSEVTVKTMPMESLEAKLHERLLTLLPSEFHEVKENPDGASDKPAGS